MDVREVIETYEQEIRNKTIDELRQRFVAEYNEMLDLDMEENINWAIRLDIIAEQMKKGGAV